MQELHIQTETRQWQGKAVAIVTLAGYLDSDTAAQLMRTLAEFIDRGTPNIVLDMSDLGYMSSAGFGVIAGAHQRAASKQGRLVITGLTDKLKAVFDNLGLPDLVEVYPDREAALSALTRPTDQA